MADICLVNKEGNVPICMTSPKRKSESEVAQSSPTLCDPMDCSLPGSSVHGIFQARILEWVAISFNPCFKTVKANYWWLLKPAKFFFLFLPLLNFQFSSVAQLYLILCDCMNRSTPGLPVHHQLLESTQTHVIELVMPSNHLILCHPFSSCPQSFPASGSFQMSQLFASGGQSIGVILNSLSVGTGILTRRHSREKD